MKALGFTTNNSEGTFFNIILKKKFSHTFEVLFGIIFAPQKHFHNLFKFLSSLKLLDRFCGNVWPVLKHLLKKPRSYFFIQFLWPLVSQI